MMDSVGILRGQPPSVAAESTESARSQSAVASRPGQTGGRRPDGPGQVPGAGQPEVGTVVAQNVRVGVVLPVYNESKLINKTFDAVLAFAATHAGYHFVFADDGSRDATAEMLRQLITRSGTTQVSLLPFPENRGKGRTVADAILRCPGEFVCFTDGDLAYSLDHLPLLVESLERNEVAIGSRSLVPGPEKNTKLARKILGWGFNRLARLIVGLPYRDTQAGLKGFRREAAKQIFSRQRLGDFSFDVEAVFLAHKLGYRVGEIPARVSEAHSYKVSKVNLFRDPLKMFLDLLRVRMMSLRGLYD